VASNFYYKKKQTEQKDPSSPITAQNNIEQKANWQIELARVSRLAMRSTETPKSSKPFFEKRLDGSVSPSAPLKSESLTQLDLLGAKTPDLIRGGYKGEIRSPLSKRTASLDNNQQNSTWSSKARRLYGACKSGMKRANALGFEVFFLTLTSAPNSRDHAKHFDLLVKRVRRELNFNFRYIKVFTLEGNGVFHVLFYDAFEGWDYDAIHAYFSCLWNELHYSPIVWCTTCKPHWQWSIRFKKHYFLNGNRICSYITQYMSKQKGFVRSSMSTDWIFKGWRKKFLGLIAKHGFKRALTIWGCIVCYFTPVHFSTSILNSTKSE